MVVVVVVACNGNFSWAYTGKFLSASAPGVDLGFGR